jgi:hypothetical protein
VIKVGSRKAVQALENTSSGSCKRKRQQEKKLKSTYDSFERVQVSLIGQSKVSVSSRWLPVFIMMWRETLGQKDWVTNLVMQRFQNI